MPGARGRPASPAPARDVAPGPGSGRRRRRCAGGGAAGRGAPPRRPRDVRRCRSPKRGVKPRPHRSTVPVPSASGTNDSSTTRRGLEGRPQRGGVERREVAEQGGHARARPRRAAYRREMASLSPCPGSATTLDAPRAPRRAPGPRRSSRGRGESGPTAARAAARVSCAMAALRSARSEPTARARRDLPWRVSLTGTTTCQPRDERGRRRVRVRGGRHAGDIVPLAARLLDTAPRGGQDEAQPRRPACARRGGRDNVTAGARKRRLPLGLPARGTPAPAAAHGADEAGLARAREHPGRGRLRRLDQPHLLRRPARLRPLHVRQRARGVLPRQGQPLRDPRRRLAAQEVRPDPRLPQLGRGGGRLPGCRRWRARRQGRSASSPRAPSPGTPTCGRCVARRAPPGSPSRRGAR